MVELAGRCRKAVPARAAPRKIGGPKVIQVSSSTASVCGVSVLMPKPGSRVCRRGVRVRPRNLPRAHRSGVHGRRIAAPPQLRSAPPPFRTVWAVVGQR